ncbi:hypothetical protein HanPSC8_Chr13g0550551 [Helianthus annuus]|nr:hypothetical protein HanIR_Chr13g0622771 [Helianthus annuus]KAJ0847882.1 hypothetical protein HanPSC8_Chr13g0550551 [Helianthus annuus]
MSIARVNSGRVWFGSCTDRTGQISLGSTQSSRADSVNSVDPANSVDPVNSVKWFDVSTREDSVKDL